MEHYEKQYCFSTANLWSEIEPLFNINMSNGLMSVLHVTYVDPEKNLHGLLDSGSAY